MTRGATRRSPASFAIVEAVGLTLPGVETATKYGGSPMLKLDDCFTASLATHRSAEPDTLVVRISLQERDLLIADAPDTYCVTDYNRKHPVVLVRLKWVDRTAPRDLLSVSWRLTSLKARRVRESRRRGSASWPQDRLPRRLDPRLGIQDGDLRRRCDLRMPSGRGADKLASVNSENG